MPVRRDGPPESIWCEMYLLDVLDKANKMRPNAAHDDIKVMLLFKNLEGDVAEMLGVDPPEYTYDVSDPVDIELLMPHPYDDIYLWFLCAQIDIMNEESQLYGNDMEIFNTAWARAQAWYRRNTRKFSKNNWKVM